MGKSRHDRIVDRIASRYGGSHLRKGVDIKVNNKAIEIATTLPDLYQSIHQLNRSRKECKYLSIPQELRRKAFSLLKGTGIGLMDGNGTILKRCRRK